MTDVFIDVDFSLIPKKGQAAAGDCFLSRKGENGGRLISVLSDGLGSGIKAGVLSTLTATMAIKCIENNLDSTRTAELIARTLPVCSERKISYATFTIVDIHGFSGKDNVHLIEYDNPSALIFKENKPVEIDRRKIFCGGNNTGRNEGFESLLSSGIGDRLIFFSDGVTQSGLGTHMYPLGWGLEAVKTFAAKIISEKPEISSRELARKITAQSVRNDAFSTRDDITVGVIYFRKPRKMIIATGPPFNAEYDQRLAQKIAHFEGKKVLCGGTTAVILSRELGTSAEVLLKDMDFSLPPMSKMDGIDLVSEGILTLGTVCEFLENGIPPKTLCNNPARMIVEMMLDSDVIHILAGTRINEAHQDPNMPVELEIRRNIVKKIQKLLKERFFKEVPLQFI